jgi:hypothetical protein
MANTTRPRFNRLDVKIECRAMRYLLEIIKVERMGSNAAVDGI